MTEMMMQTWKARTEAGGAERTVALEDGDLDLVAGGLPSWLYYANPAWKAGAALYEYYFG